MLGTTMWSTVGLNEGLNMNCTPGVNVMFGVTKHSPVGVESGLVALARSGDDIVDRLRPH